MTGFSGGLIGLAAQLAISTLPNLLTRLFVVAKYSVALFTLHALTKPSDCV